MPIIPDLTPHESDHSVKYVGYLGGVISQGLVPCGFLEKLENVESWLRSRITSQGRYRCPYCGGATSCKENIAGGFIWNEMLKHYIEEHGYKPPDEFIEFIMTVRQETIQALGDRKKIEVPPFDF
ncbi:MAG TPA: hypothetical protein VJK53_03640 [Candidatus Paceibacterota bacterium]